ncbi:MAG: phosphopentomutase [Vulcanimicrobiaceae bacterium]
MARHVAGRHHSPRNEAVRDMSRCVVIVLDSAGIGALPDAASFGDAPNANTIGNVADRVGGLTLPHFERLGLGHLTSVRGVPASANPAAYVARLGERSCGKDTITGHWEMAGIHTVVPFPTFPRGFPPELVLRFAAICGREPLGNRAASGTEIIAELGAEHLASGQPILYTSADSVFQVAAHEAVVPLETLYRWCEEARAMLRPPFEVNRVIARPFVGEPGAFVRTPNRRDYALDPPENLLDRLAASNVPVHAVGKISDIFNRRSVATSVRVADNEAAMARTFELLQTVDSGFVFTNLNDFDSTYGHRRDVRGYARALERLDRHVPALEAHLRPGDVAIFTADHGCDPTAPGSDHTREYVPYLEIGVRRGPGGTRTGLDLVGERVLATLGVPPPVRA